MSKYANKLKEQNRSRKKRKTFGVDGSLSDSEWIKCPKCHEDLKSNNLENHLGKVHDVKMLKKEKGNKDIIPFVILLIVISGLIGIGVYLFIDSDNGDVDTNVEDNDFEEPSESWLDTYSPKKRVGSSDDDWWTSYPNQNPDRGEVVNHPSWIEEKLKEGPILVFAHSDNCMPCIEQQESVDEIMKNYGDEIHLFDYMSGVDARASEVFNIYDPNGSPNYIPLTLIITIVEDSSGNERIGWHATEGATGGEWLTNYVKDAIYYHHQNIDEWS